MNIKLQLRIIVRQPFPQKCGIVLESDVTNTPLSIEALSQLIFDIENTLNEYMPQIRVHSDIRINEEKK